ncbi:MAG: hypothetical protein V4486_02630 [Patescibacteria group bacterium]
MPNLKNIIIFIAIGAALVLGYVFFIRKPPEDSNLLTTTTSATPIDASIPGASPDLTVGQDFLNLLLNVKNIKLDESLFADPAFATLRDSSIVLVQEGNEGRANPFAPIGSDPTAPATPTTPIPMPSGAPGMPN